MGQDKPPNPENLGFIEPLCLLASYSAYLLGRFLVNDLKSSEHAIW